MALSWKFEDLIALLSSKLIQEYQYWGTKNVCETIPQAHVFAKYSYFLQKATKDFLAN